MTTIAAIPPKSRLEYASRVLVLVFSDIEGSVQFKTTHGTPAYAKALSRHDALFRESMGKTHDGQILKDTGDGFFAAFSRVSDAVIFALRFQHAMGRVDWGPEPLRARLGVHIGEVTELEKEASGIPKIIGMAADIAARVMSLATGGQILMTRAAFDEARQFVRHHPDDTGAGSPALEWKAHGGYLFQGADSPIDVFEVGAANEAPLRPPPDSGKARRAVAAEEEAILGWRPASGLEVPQRAGWRLEKKLGDGGFGEVWLARNLKTKLRRVFKFCFDAERLHSFKRELTLFKLLRSALGERDDIARLYDVKLDQTPFFIESEYSEGGNLADWAVRQGGIAAVPLPTRIELVWRVADAVSAAHSVAILHKDIKPTNILIQDVNGPPRPRLSDFGISAVTDASQLRDHNITVTGLEQTMSPGKMSSLTGTRMYTPPELLAGAPFTIQGDIYALGVLLYQMVVGDLNRPLAEGWERDIDDEVLRDDIAACVDGEPSRRLSSAAELSHRLRSIEKRRPTLIQRADRWLRRNKPVGALVLLMIFGLFGYVGWLYARPAVLELQTLPKGAHVWVDGVKDKCCTPVVLSLSKGRHEIRLQYPDHVETARTVSVSWGRARGSAFEPIVLMPSYQYVIFNSEPAGAVVELTSDSGEKFISTTNGHLKLPAGAYSGTITLNGYRPETVRLYVKGDSAPQELDRKLEPISTPPAVPARDQ